MAMETTPSALDDILLEETDEEDVTTSVYSRVAVEYDHASFSGGRRNDRVRIKGAQAFGSDHRVGFGYELPFISGYGIDLGDGTPSPSAQGLGDIKVNVNAVLGMTPRFKHAAKIEFTFPSASEDVIGFGQKILRIEWGCSTPIGAKTALSGIFAYNRAISTRDGNPGQNSFEPEVVLTRAFTPSIAAYLDYDMYRDFSAEDFGQTLKAGMTISIDKAQRWALSPYAQFPLNHFTSSTNLKSDVGIELGFRY